MSALHIVFGNSETFHEARNHTVEKEKCGILECGSQRCYISVGAFRMYRNDNIGQMCQFRIFGTGNAYGLRSYAFCYFRRFDDGHGISAVGYENYRIFFADNRSCHISDEIDFQSELDQPYREQLGYQSGSAHAEYEYRFGADNGIRKGFPVFPSNPG